MYCILLTVGIVVAAILSLLAAPESAVMTAPGAAGSDGAVAMTITSFSVSLILCVIYLGSECIFYHI